MPENYIVSVDPLFAHQCRKIDGLPDRAGRQLKKIEKAGRSGYAFKQMGERAEPSPLYIETLSSSVSGSATLWALIKGTQGGVVDIYDANGGLWQTLVVERVHLNRRKRMQFALWNGVAYQNPIVMNIEMTVTYPYGS